MAERLYGISYYFSKIPETKTIAEDGFITYSPVVVCFDEKDDRHYTISYPSRFKISFQDKTLYTEGKSHYRRLIDEARKNQERLIADYICACILDELKKFPDDEFVFVVHDSFESEKFVGRLGYLGLPLDKCTFYFVSSNLKDLLTNYLAPFSENRFGDLSLLRKQPNRLFGPFPEDEEATMLRTFFCTFPKEELYPLRINLFAQFMDHPKLDVERQRLRNRFFSPEWTELYNIDGGHGSEHTRLPKVLVRCEDYIENVIRLREDLEKRGEEGKK